MSVLIATQLHLSISSCSLLKLICRGQVEWKGYGLQVNPQCRMFGPPTPPIIEFLDLHLQSALE